MKLNFSMPKALIPYYFKELVLADTFLSENNLEGCWHHYERAHIIAQRFPLQHTFVHWKMLLFGLRIKNTKEVIGQIPRLLFGGVKSFVGTIPIGNTGGANVPALQPMQMPHDLQKILETII